MDLLTVACRIGLSYQRLLFNVAVRDRGVAREHSVVERIRVREEVKKIKSQIVIWVRGLNTFFF